MIVRNFPLACRITKMNELLTIQEWPAHKPQNISGRSFIFETSWRFRQKNGIIFIFVVQILSQVSKN